jgi:hypothetical protein
MPMKQGRLEIGIEKKVNVGIEKQVTLIINS